MQQDYGLLKNLFLIPIAIFFVEIDEEEFRCATWEQSFFDKVPQAKQKSFKEFLLGGHTPVYLQSWKKSVMKRYQIEPDVLDRLFSTQIFAVTSRTFRNHFTRLCQLEQPVLAKIDSSQGKYKKIKLSNATQDNLDVSELWHDSEDNLLNFLNEGLSTIAELLLTKINGEQRLFIHTDYIVTEELQDNAGDYADQLKEVWRESSTRPLKIKYNSASKKNTKQYLVFPVCIYYYQRACYLCGFGQNPHHDLHEFSWYNYRLERIEELKQTSWQADSLTTALQAEIYQESQVKYQYTPDYIQGQLNLGYGFDFYRNLDTMLLRFNRDFSRNYINNTDRHPTFIKINLEENLKQLIIKHQYLTEKQQQYLLDKIQDTTNNYDYYSLNYRVDDNNVIMRLRSWSPNVEVVLPWNLRQRMKQDMEKTWKLYESD